MTFYSYEHLYAQNQEPNFLFIFVLSALSISLIITGALYFRNRKDNKYRDLAVIFGFGIALFIGINYNNYEKQIDVNNQTNQTLTLMNSIAKEKKISKKKLYSNSSSLSEGMLIKNGKNYYRVSFDNTTNSYTLSKASIVDSSQINLVK
ncbi:DUF3290 domain-containing protein [Companilactobacillus allii]|uniref:DUF3290 domain-containing protein n=1 Tax=Companilactobacillus allii TaxID=1847728 RepID=A0A1P8Q2U4_9LACO|nr:DUF3290 family protein [Companilactobacillus allii]APX72146.1 hypothetical protein BTM29_06045 [Companilactobacillus allii]USQ69243.1 DUF3290 domain-containing protein [Companilactobacillus allii]